MIVYDVYQVHINSPDWLVFTLLPFSSYKIYEIVLQHVDTSVRYDNVDCTWLPQFKQSCVPTSQPGLHRHVAMNQAFFRFLCEAGVELGKHVTEYPECKMHKQTVFLMTTLLGGLENMKNISDQHVILLLQVTLMSFKTSNSDISSLGLVLMGYVLPRMKLKEKVVSKLSKSLAKFSSKNQSETTLNLVLLLSRTQNTKKEMILEMILEHSPTVNDIVSKSGRSVDNDVADQLDALVFSLVNILETLLPRAGEMKISVTSKEQELMKMMTGLSGVVEHVSEETTEHVLSVVMDFIKVVETGDDSVSIIKKLNKIVDLFRLRYPEVFRRVALDKRGERGDIFFIPSVDSPSELELGAAKIISSNQLISVLSTTMIVNVKPGKKSRKIMKMNREFLSTVLRCSTEFLKSQLPENKLETLLINLLRVISVQESGNLTPAVLNHLCSGSIDLSQTNIVELLLVSVLISSPASRSLILSSEFAKSSSLLSLLSSLSADSDDFSVCLMEKLSVLMEPVHLNTILDNKCLLHNSVLVSAVLSISDRLSDQCSSELASLLAAVIGCEIIDTDQNKITDDWMTHSTSLGLLPWSLLISALQHLLSKITGTGNGIVDKIFPSLVTLVEKGAPENSLSIFKIITQHLELDTLNFLLKTSHDDDLKLACFSLTMAAHYCQENVKDTKAALKNKSDDSLLHLLSSMLSPNTKVQKAAFKVMSKIDLAATGPLKHILQYFKSHKEEIVHGDATNVSNELEKESLDDKACRKVLSRASSSVDNVDIFIKLSPLFIKLTSEEDTATLAQFGLSCLENEKDEALVVIIDQFVPNHLHNLHQQELWNFFESLVKSKLMISVSGIRRSVSQFLMSRIINSGQVNNIKVELHHKLLSLFTTNMGSEFYIEAKNLLLALNLKTEAFIEEFNNIWGKETFSGKRTSGRGKFSLIYGGEVSAEDAVRWSRSCWVLEILENILRTDKNKNERDAGDWLPLLRTLFVLLRKVASIESEDTSYKMSLILNVLHHLMTNVSDSKLQKIDQSQVTN